MSDNINLIIPVISTMNIPSVEQIRIIQSLVTEKLIQFNCVDPSEAPIYSIKVKFQLGDSNE